MNWLKVRWFTCVISLTLTSAIVLPGCALVVAIFYDFIIPLGEEVAMTYVGDFIEKKLDAWTFNKSDSHNHGGDVIADANNPLTGRFNGIMKFTVVDQNGNGRSTTVEIPNPKMHRDAADASSPWKLDNDVTADVRKRLSS